MDIVDFRNLYRLRNRRESSSARGAESLTRALITALRDETHVDILFLSKAKVFGDVTGEHMILYG